MGFGVRVALITEVSDWAWMITPGFIVPAFYALMSAVTFLAFGWDKWSAKRARQRVPESTLHLLELFGGWPGALVAQRVLRHKTEKLGFKMVLWSIVALHLAAWGLLAYLAASRR